MHFGTCYVDCKPQTQQGSPASASRVYLFFFFLVETSCATQTGLRLQDAKITGLIPSCPRFGFYILKRLSRDR